MKTASSLMFAYRLLFPRTGKKSNARRSLVGAFVCIGISLVPLVMVLSISDGMIQGITERMIGLSSSHINCILYSDSPESNSAESLAELSRSLEKVESVEFAYPEIKGIGLASSSAGRTGATVRAVETDVFSRNQAFRSLFKVTDGEMSLATKNSAIIGEKLADTLHLKAGDTFRLITTKETGDGRILPKITPFKITGIVSSGYQELDALWVFIPLQVGYSVLPLKSSTISIGIETKNAFGQELEQAFNDLQFAVPAMTKIYRWNEINAAEYQNFASTQIMLLVIMMLIVLVASVNISSALVMLVMERRKEIAILKSLGATSGGITQAFLITGMVTGALGVLIGIPCGLLCSVNFNVIMNNIEKFINIFTEFHYILLHGSMKDFSEVHLLDPAFYLQDVPMAVPLGQLVIIASGTLVLSLFMSALPAIKAGSEKPIDTLRKI